jgi:urea transport system permease protein
MRIILLLISFACVFSANTVRADESSLSEVIPLLTSRDFDKKAQGIQLLTDSGYEKTELLLNAILSGDLYYVKKTKRLAFIKDAEKGKQATDALNGEDLGTMSKRKLKKVSINNSLRQILKISISNLKLNNPDAQVREQAVSNLMGQADEDMIVLLKQMLSKEKNVDVIQAINEVVAFTGLDSEEPGIQLQAIEVLKDQLNPDVLNKFRQLEKTGNDKAVKTAAAKAVKKIESRVSMFSYIETLFFGLSLGSILALAAIGLAITFGVMGVINMAHGELIMIGAYTTYVVQLLMPDNIGASVIISIPAAFIVSGLVGIAIERGVIRFLYGRPLETLLATFGISLFLQQTVRSIFSPLNRSVETPAWMSGSLEINSLLSITYNRLYIFLFCLIVFVLLFLVMKKTSLGLHVRAVSQNRNMARAMGIKSEWVDAMTFGLGSGIAGVAGVALSQITNVGPNLGQAYIVDSFMVVVFGGVGNLWGTLISGLSLGVVGKYLEPVTGAVLAKILVLIFIILFIQKRPRGLFPQKGRAAE